MTTTAEAASPLPHEEMPGRSQASSSPSGGLTRSGTYGGALKGANARGPAEPDPRRLLDDLT